MKLLSQPLLSITDYDVERMIQKTGAETGAKAGRAPLELCPELDDVYNQRWRYRLSFIGTRAFIWCSTSCSTSNCRYVRKGG